MPLRPPSWGTPTAPRRANPPRNRWSSTSMCGRRIGSSRKRKPMEGCDPSPQRRADRAAAIDLQPGSMRALRSRISIACPVEFRLGPESLHAQSCNRRRRRRLQLQGPLCAALSPRCAVIPSQLDRRHGVVVVRVGLEVASRRGSNLHLVRGPTRGRRRDDPRERPSGMDVRIVEEASVHRRDRRSVLHQPDVDGVACGVVEAAEIGSDEHRPPCGCRDDR